MEKEFYNREDVKKIINRNRGLLRKELNQGLNKELNQEFYELSSTTLDNYIFKFIKRADHIKKIIERENTNEIQDSLSLDYLKNFFSLEQEIKYSTEIEENVLEYRFSEKTASILILVGTFGDDFGFSKFFYSNLISEQLIKSCEIALNHIDLFIIKDNDDEKSGNFLYLKSIKKYKEEIKKVLEDFLNGVKETKNELYEIQNKIFQDEYEICIKRMSNYSPKLKYTVMQVYLAGAIDQTRTLIDKHITKNNIKPLEEIIEKKNILNDNLKNDVQVVTLISNI